MIHNLSQSSLIVSSQYRNIYITLLSEDRIINNGFRFPAACDHCDGEPVCCWLDLTGAPLKPESWFYFLVIEAKTQRRVRVWTSVV